MMFTHWKIHKGSLIVILGLLLLNLTISTPVVQGQELGPFDVQTPLAPQVPNDQVIADDLIVTGSQCIGFDCLTDGSESFGFDTLRLKENNLQIHFDDTSATAGFPANDWRIITNDSSSGGTNYFAIQDSTAGRTLFKLMAGAPVNAFYMSSNGRLGLGTETPAYPVELEKTGMDAIFAVQRTDGATGALTAGAAGVQVGSITTHSLALVVNNTPVMTLDTGGKLQVYNAGITWTLTFTESGLTIAPNDGSPNAFVLDASGNLTLAGAVIESSDVNVKENFVPVDSAAVLAQVAGLPITTWNYQADAATRHMGPMAQDFYAAFDLGVDDRHLAPLDANGVALAAIQALAQQNQAQGTRLAQLEQENADLAARLAALEALVLKLAQE